MVKLIETTVYKKFGNHNYAIKLSGNKYYVYVKSPDNNSGYYYAVGDMFGKGGKPAGNITFDIYSPDTDKVVSNNIYANPTKNDYRDLLNELEIYNKGR